MNNSDIEKNIIEIWALFRENREQLHENRIQLELMREQFQETERLIKEESLKTDRRFQETERFLKEESLKTDRRFQESDRRFQETERLLKEESLKSEQHFQETERLIKEESRKTDEQMRRTDQRINQLYGTFSNQWGRLMEAMMEPDATRMFQERGIEIVGTYSRVKRAYKGDSMEIDVLLIDSNEVVMMEIKTQVSHDDVTDLLADLSRFGDFFPEYRQYKLYGAIAGLDIPTQVGRAAYKRGLFVVGMSGEGFMEIKNDALFTPKNFGYQPNELQ